MSVITQNLAVVKEHIKELSLKAGRPDDAVKLIAVSKTRSLEEVQHAVDAGQCDFGENTVQDALTKIPALITHDIDWHFIGHLQSKKAKHIPGHFQWIHSIDSLKLAQKLSAAVVHHDENISLNCLIQVNVAEEVSKSGLSQREVIPFLNELLQQELPCLNWRGLMTIGVQGDDMQTGRAFAALRNLLHKCQQTSGLKNFDQLSMGMSNDYAIAIQEGSTMVRIGTAIFGQRAQK
jgi:pyridoxal phosphate enzyme (YggS family)